MISLVIGLPFLENYFIKLTSQLYQISHKQKTPRLPIEGEIEILATLMDCVLCP